MPPDLSSLYRTFVQVFPPSAVRKIPRSSSGRKRGPAPRPARYPRSWDRRPRGRCAAYRPTPMGPRLAAIGGLVHAVAKRNVAANASLAGAHVNHIGIGGRRLDRADRADIGAVRQRRPGDASVGRLPHAAGHRAEVIDWVPCDTRYREGASAAARSHQAPLAFLSTVQDQSSAPTQESRKSKQIKPSRTEIFGAETPLVENIAELPPRTTIWNSVKILYRSARTRQCIVEIILAACYLGPHTMCNTLATMPAGDSIASRLLRILGCFDARSAGISGYRCRSKRRSAIRHHLIERIAAAPQELPSRDCCRPMKIPTGPKSANSS